MQLNRRQCFGTGSGVEIFLYLTTNIFLAKFFPPMELHHIQNTQKHTSKLEVDVHL